MGLLANRDSKGRFVTALRKKALSYLRPRRKIPPSLPTKNACYGVSGRRIIDLEYLAEQLECDKCKNGLLLKDLIKETSRVGLCSILQFNCQNCSARKIIYTSRFTGEGTKKQFTVNKKLALGVVGSGLPQQKCWSFMAMLNVPPPSFKFGLELVQREGQQFQKLAKASCYQACLLEKKAQECLDDACNSTFVENKRKVFSVLSAKLNIPQQAKETQIVSKAAEVHLTRGNVNKLSHTRKTSVKRALAFSHHDYKQKKQRLDTVDIRSSDTSVSNDAVAQSIAVADCNTRASISPEIHSSIGASSSPEGACIGNTSSVIHPPQKFLSTGVLKHKKLPNILRRRLPLQKIDQNILEISTKNVSKTHSVAERELVGCPTSETTIQSNSNLGPPILQTRLILNPITGEMEEYEEEPVTVAAKKVICPPKHRKKGRRGKNSGKKSLKLTAATSGAETTSTQSVMIESSPSEIPPAANESPACSSTVTIPGSETEEMPYRSDNMTSVDAGADAGWQKRGCGKSYNSRSGHNSLVGQKTGLILDYEVLQTACSKCSRTPNENCGQASCNKNYQGSAKSMEAASAVRLVCMSDTLRRAGIKIGRLVTDEDATTHSAIRRHLRNEEVQKLLDWPHALRIFKREMILSHVQEHIISYFAKCAAAAILSNKDEAKKMQADLKNLTKHAQGMHSDCQDWCRAKEEGAQYKHRNLKRDLTSTEVKNVFEPLEKLAGKSEMLAPLCTTQRNEAFNSLMSQFAPKNCNFNLTKNIQYRAAAAVAQFNTGPQFPKLLFAQGDHSPDRTGYWDQRELQLGSQATRKTTRVAKKQRSRLREKRSGRLARQERNETDTYSTGIASNEQALQEVCERGRASTKSYGGMPMASSPKVQIDGSKLIFFDLETSGRSPKYHEILQIAATTGVEKFNAYAMPKRPITAEASKVNGIVLIGNQLHQMGNIVEAQDQDTTTEQFMDFIERVGQPAILVSHNLQFDLSFLYEAVVKANLIKRFHGLVQGGICTLAQSRSSFKSTSEKPENNTVEKVATHLLGQNFKFVAHDARGDAEAVFRIYPELTKLSPGEKHSLTLDFYAERRHRSHLFAELAFLLKEKTIVKAPFLEALIENGLTKEKLKVMKNSLSEKDFSDKVKKVMAKSRKGKQNFESAVNFLFQHL